MKANRSIPPSTVIPVLTYPDVPAAASWLASAFGAVERVRIGDGHRVQMSTEDLAGHRWTFTESIADVAPEEYDCTTVEAWRHP